VREVREEVGIEVDAAALELLGALTYLFPTKPEWSQVSRAFRVVGDFGDARASDELSASWVAVSEVPLDLMWDDAKYWLPGLLGGDPVVATFEFGADLSTVVGGPET
jgi:8-oxo-dGTP diphosphatase